MERALTLALLLLLTACAPEPKTTADVIADTCERDGGKPQRILTPWRMEIECIR